MLDSLDKFPTRRIKSISVGSVNIPDQLLFLNVIEDTLGHVVVYLKHFR